MVDRLENIGLKQVIKLGKCEADKFTQGRYDVPNGEGGHYAIVFDNTFSKSTGKMVTFFLLTYPTSAQHQISFGAQSHQHSSAMAAAMTMAPMVSKSSPRIGAKPSTDSLKAAGDATPKITPALATPKLSVTDSSHVFQGVLHKRRRKRGQGWARRFFSLDYSSSTLSYYHDRNSSALRGAIPLSLAAIGANAKTREISIDSGAEIWHLRAHNAQDFQEWKIALERASQIRADTNDLSLDLDVNGNAPSLSSDDLNWERLESLLSKISGTRDAVRRLCSDTERFGTSSQPLFLDGAAPSTPEREEGSYFPEEKRAFWKRKPSGNETNRNIFKRSVSTQLAVPLSGSAPASPASSGVHDNMKQILDNLDTVIRDFAGLVAEAKSRNTFIVPQSAVSRMSIESQEYFDAEDRHLSQSNTQLLDIEDESDAEDKPSADSDTSSSVDERELVGGRPFRSSSLSSLMPPPAKTLTPLPIGPVKRRATVREPTVMPPSLVSFLRKNVGKDLSTISMPVSANEPISLLQKAAENFEYSELLDEATTLQDPADRLLRVTAFALSSLSNARVKERNIRKPFNPMLGETYELVREDKNFRFVAEKVSHRPVQLAYYAEGRSWCVSQSPLPSQKFWGKSSEIITDGKVRALLHNVGEAYSWAPATCFLRNIIAGEKYTEPVGKMTIACETTGWQCIVTFKVKGMFSGRSEEVDVQMLDHNNVEQKLGLSGSWTSSLVIKEGGKADAAKEIWHAGMLVDRPEKHYGMTTFAAELNEITTLEKDKLPPTDSRLRADQRALEEGRYDDAERLKNEIEEGQRARRRELEAAGESWLPKFFAKVNNGPDGEVIWKPKTAHDGYWDRRARSDWSGVIDVLGTGMAVHKQDPGRF